MTKPAIVFVHGLGGDPSLTWGRFRELILADPDLQDFDAAFFGYPTSLFRLPFSKRFPRIQTLADALRTVLNTRYGDRDNLVLACHSLGGLIARRYLIDEIKRKEKLRVRGLLLYAVPNDGAGLAAVGSLISWRHNQLRQLCRESDLLRDLESDWTTSEMTNHVKVRYVVGGLDRVVSEGSARSSWASPDVDVIADRGHIDIVKPKDIDDLPYLLLRKFVLSLVQPASTVPPASGRGRRALSARGDPERVDLAELKPLEVLGKTRHSTIEACTYKGDKVVLKKTRAELCDLEALHNVMRASRDPLQGWPEAVRSLVAAPTAAWIQDGLLWEVQRFETGVSLGTLVLRHQHAFNGSILQECADSVMRLLLVLKELGLLHRDISPYNLLITHAGELRLLDWTFCIRETTQAIPVVTTGYTAPEQAQGNPAHASDWYSLGATLSFLASGSAPPPCDSPEFEQGLEYIDHDVQRLDIRVGDKWYYGLSSLCELVLNPSVEMRPTPTRFGWTPVSSPKPLVETFRIFQLAERNHLLVAENHHWVLPRDFERLEQAVSEGYPLSPEAEALVATYRGWVRAR